MIFVTVGAQMPFDRMVRAVDLWAGSVRRDDVFAQIGPDAWEPKHIDWVPFLTPAEFGAMVDRADVIVAHAGMGSIIAALTKNTPILVMPRRGALLETRNDHQVATARRFAELGQITMAMDETELQVQLDQVDNLKAASNLGPYASDQLLDTLRSFINGENDS